MLAWPGSRKETKDLACAFVAPPAKLALVQVFVRYVLVRAFLKILLANSYEMAGEEGVILPQSAYPI